MNFKSSPTTKNTIFHRLIAVISAVIAIIPYIVFVDKSSQDMDISIQILKQNADKFSGYFFKFLNYCTNEDNFANDLHTGFTLEHVMKIIVF